MSAARRPFATSAVVGVALLAVLTACTDAAAPVPRSGEPSESAPSSSEPSGPAEPVTLTFGVGGDRILRRGFANVASVYTNQHPEVTIDVVRLDQGESLAEEVRARRPDVFVATNEQAPELVAEKLVQPVDELLADRGLTFGDNVQRLGLEAFSADQALQCMPYDVSPLVMFYNPGLVPFQRLTLPGRTPPSPSTGWGWQQLASAARLISAGDGVTGAYVDPSLDTLMALVRSGGADIVDDPRDATTLTLSDPLTRSVMETVLEVVRDPSTTLSQAQVDRTGVLRRFADERLGMFFGTRALVPRLRKVTDFDFDVFPLPRLARTRSVADVSGYCLAAGTDHVAAAADFIAFAGQGRGSEIMAETGEVVPAYLPTLNSLSFTQPGENPASVFVFPDALRRSTLAPFTAQWPTLRAQIEPQIQRLYDEPFIDLDQILPSIDAVSADILAPPLTSAP